MRKTAERLIATQTYDRESGLARQIAEREADEKRVADQRIAEAKDAELAGLKMEYDAAKGVIQADFERRRRTQRRLLGVGTGGGGGGRPRAIMGQPEILRPLSSGRKTGL
jgi:hypothetical protein